MNIANIPAGIARENIAELLFFNDWWFGFNEKNILNLAVLLIVSELTKPGDLFACAGNRSGKWPKQDCLSFVFCVL